MFKIKYVGVPILLWMIFLFQGCSINKFAMNKVADALTSSTGGSVFTSDNDPELVGDALPFAIKMYESLLSSAPSHSGLRLKTGSLYIMYANAFLYTPATMLGEDDYKKHDILMKRAKNLYLRGRDIILEGLDKKYSGFLETLNKKDFNNAFRRMKKKDAPFLYWAAAGWMGAYSIDPFDMKLGIHLPKAAEIMKRVPVLDKDFEKGSIHDFYISYYGSLPEYMGGDSKKAREHFKKAVQFTGGRSLSPYVSLATSVSIKTQDLKEFRSLLKKAIKIDTNSDPDNRLVNILNKRKAEWFLEHEEDFFLSDEPETEDEEE
ncbi:MAG: TRAP transporter TatT component family protein [Acidobacteriota bacterium]